MRSFITTVGIFIATNFFAQNYCSTTEMQNEWFATHPQEKIQFEKLQQQAAEVDRELFKNGYLTGVQQKGAAATYTIPVVFHILHTGSSENISDAQVHDAVQILNEDFNKLNADTSNVVAQFKNMIGNAQISFVLAGKDPQGNCTNGIIRHWDANTNWGSGFSGYAYTWPAFRYLNIYVVKTIGSGAAGYTYLPGSGVPASADAIVILNSYVGSIGTGNSGTSRALTHEVGHWLNLPHVWGGTNQPGVACGDDGVTDTPVTKGYSSCNLNNTAICNPNIVENIQNYMDYAYCQRMFTTGQAVRMQNAITSSIGGRSNLSASNNLIFTGVTSSATNCLTKLDLNTNAFTICTGQSASIMSYTSNAAPLSYSWSVSGGAIIQNPTAAVTTITYTSPGITIVNCDVTTSAGTTSKSMTVNVISGLANITSSNMESFEDPSYQIPVDWIVENPTTVGEHWEVYPFAASIGAQCMYIPTENLSPNSIEILESPAYDFKNNPGAKFTFKYAYAKQDANNKDVFKVQASKNCGGTWTDVYVPSNTQMSQGSGGITSNLFLMPSPSEWKFYDLTLHPNFNQFMNSPNVKIRFYFQEDVGGNGYGNRIYLDEVNFSSFLSVGVNELSRSIDLGLYPNPTNSEFKLGFTLSNESDIRYQVLSVAGAVVLSGSHDKMQAGSHEILLNSQRELAAGVYIVQLEKDGVKMSRKLVIN